MRLARGTQIAPNQHLRAKICGEGEESKRVRPSLLAKFGVCQIRASDTVEFCARDGAAETWQPRCCRCCCMDHHRPTKLCIGVRDADALWAVMVSPTMHTAAGGAPTGGVEPTPAVTWPCCSNTFEAPLRDNRNHNHDHHRHRNRPLLTPPRRIRRPCHCLCQDQGYVGGQPRWFQQTVIISASPTLLFR